MPDHLLHMSTFCIKQVFRILQPSIFCTLQLTKDPAHYIISNVFSQIHFSMSNTSTIKEYQVEHALILYQIWLYTVAYIKNNYVQDITAMSFILFSCLQYVPYVRQQYLYFSKNLFYYNFLSRFHINKHILYAFCAASALLYYT